MNPPQLQAIGPNRFNLLRLLAAAQVLLVHSLNHLNYAGPLLSLLKSIPGVPVFFFISGMLISHAYRRTQSVGLRAFFRNRALRIFPALWAVVLLSAAMLFAVGFLEPSFLLSPRFLVWMAGQSSVVQFYNPDFLRSFGVGVLNGALWTISVELQFYLLTPLLVFLLQRRPIGFALIFVMSLSLNLWLRFAPTGSPFLLSLLYVSSLPWLYMFMTGMLAVLRLKWLKELVAKWPWAVWLALYAAAMTLIGDYEANASNAIHPLAFGVLAMVVLKAAFPSHLKEGVVASFIQRNDLSYGLYLVHMPVINLLLYLGWSPPGWDLATAVSASLMLALLSWFCVERPALRRKI
jgi:peptidoglycan/LPS O-acetylase OafA/YrhL